MDRKLFGPFSGTHLTIMACVAMLIPGALYGATAFTNVAITDASTGTTAIVDSKQRLHIVDNVAALTNNPALVINIKDDSPTSSSSHTIYTVPDRQILLVKSISWSYYSNQDG